MNERKVAEALHRISTGVAYTAEGIRQLAGAFDELPEGLEHLEQPVAELWTGEPTEFQKLWAEDPMAAPPPKKRSHVSRTTLYDPILQTAARHEGASLASLATAVGRTKGDGSLRAAINDLIAAGRLRKTGAKMNRRFVIGKPNDERDNRGKGQGVGGRPGAAEMNRRRFRDWAAKQAEPFTYQDIEDALDLTRNTARNAAQWALKRKIVEQLPGIKTGTGRPPTRFGYVKPEAGSTRPKAEAKGNGAEAVPGTGKQRTARKEVGKLLGALHAGGWKTDLSGGHYKVYDPDGTYVGTLPGTPSDHRSLRNAKQKLKKAGAPV